MHNQFKYVGYLSFLILIMSVEGCGVEDTSNALLPSEHYLKEYAYPNGGVMRLDFLGNNEELRRSKWFHPNGTFLAESVFVNGSGIEFYLYPDGSLKQIVRLKNGLFDGKVIELDTDGAPSRVTTFSRGIEGATRKLLVVSSPQDGSKGTGVVSGPKGSIDER